MSAGDVAQALKRALQGAWFGDVVRTGRNVGNDKACEDTCAKLLAMCCEGYTPAGIRPSRPWGEFFGELKAPENPGQRVCSNLERYAGNYLNVVFGLALLISFLERPGIVGFACIAQVFPLLAPPEIFHIDVRRFGKVAAGDAFVDIGGSRLRLLLTVLAHVFLWAAVMSARGSRTGLILGSCLAVTHALSRTRPWSVLAKEKLGVKKSM
eukprot:TRINITY_DN20757_c0_g2_i1.p1 TRINITY_DN20757_c0_g2~~TRINITY_DN20757_c0_g2_i1.p1  ORF type:complete len:239 (-),score=32.10 TRINITY_DN20757_c0_g2_i1:27-656(-)